MYYSTKQRHFQQESEIFSESIADAANTGWVDQLLADLELPADHPAASVALVASHHAESAPPRSPLTVDEMLADFDMDTPAYTPPRPTPADLIREDRERKAAKRLERELQEAELRVEQRRAKTRERVQRHRAAKAAPVDHAILATSPEPTVPRNFKVAYHRRKGLLVAARGDRVADQLRGREALITKVWLVRHHNPGASDSRVATLIGSGLTKRSVQSYRKMIAKLEAPGGIWA